MEKKTHEIIGLIAENASREYTKSKGQLRFGQCIWNEARDLATYHSTGLAMALENIRSSGCDPFYKDENTTNFYEALNRKESYDWKD